MLFLNYVSTFMLFFTICLPLSEVALSVVHTVVLMCNGQLVDYIHCEVEWRPGHRLACHRGWLVQHRFTMAALQHYNIQHLPSWSPFPPPQCYHCIAVVLPVGVPFLVGRLGTSAVAVLQWWHINGGCSPVGCRGEPWYVVGGYAAVTSVAAEDETLLLIQDNVYFTVVGNCRPPISCHTRSQRHHPYAPTLSSSSAN